MVKGISCNELLLIIVDVNDEVSYELTKQFVKLRELKVIHSQLLGRLEQLIKLECDHYLSGLVAPNLQQLQLRYCHDSMLDIGKSYPRMQLFKCSWAIKDFSSLLKSATELRHLEVDFEIDENR